ncbi:LOW QUALITY PROTEIN: hypothetical protein ColTof4_04002 [Colletotrichum tofieldiae]|nr:LOW QUALITY PROTEIN: hypothetical protein ColTof3_13849 [Colletotrichum tofieldiae]GKT71579.1 LOW QUALITY PROTEIN: hypothetical protein ColTof4_04002 [Colletotrichum tofieldiae]
MPPWATFNSTSASITGTVSIPMITASMGTATDITSSPSASFTWTNLTISRPPTGSLTASFITWRDNGHSVAHGNEPEFYLDITGKHDCEPVTEYQWHGSADDWKRNLAPDICQGFRKPGTIFPYWKLNPDP